MTPETVQFLTHCLVLGTAALGLAVGAVWLAWDAWAYRRFGRRATESHYIWLLSQRFPLAFLPIFLGLAFLCWHFFVGPPAPGVSP